MDDPMIFVEIADKLGLTVVFAWLLITQVPKLTMLFIEAQKAQAVALQTVGEGLKALAESHMKGGL